MSKEELIKLLSELKKSSFDDNAALAQISEIEKIIELKNAKEQEMLKFKEEMEKVDYIDDRLINLREMVSNSEVALKENQETIERNNLIVKYIKADINQLNNEIENLKLENEEIKLNMNEIDGENYQTQFNNQLNVNLTKISELNEKINEYNNLINRYNQFIDVTKGQTAFLEEQVSIHKNNLAQYENNIKSKKDKKEMHLEQTNQALSLMEVNALYANDIKQMSDSANNNVVDENTENKLNNYKSAVAEPLLLNSLEKRNEEIIKNTMAKNYFAVRMEYLSNSKEAIENDKTEIEKLKLNLKETEKNTRLVGIENNILSCTLDNYNLDQKISVLEKENKSLKRKGKSMSDEDKKSINTIIDNNQHEISNCKDLIIANYNEINKNKKEAEEIKNELMIISNLKEQNKNNNTLPTVLIDEEKGNNKLIVSALEARNKTLKSDLPLLLVNGQTNQNDFDKSNAIDVEYKVLDDKPALVDSQQTKEIKEPVQLEIKSVKRPNREKMISKIKKVSAAIVASMVLVISGLPNVEKNNNLNNMDINTKIVENIEDDKMIGNEDDFYEEVKDEVASQVRVNDFVTIANNGNIYYTQYDATSRTNPKSPLNDRSMERNVIGITVKMPDGTLQFVQSNEKIESLLEQGGEITSYLTGNDLEAEGFWNADDVVKVQKLDNQLGGMTR